MIVQKLEQELGFLGLEPDDAAGETWVDVERCFARDGVTPDEGVLSTGESALARVKGGGDEPRFRWARGGRGHHGAENSRPARGHCARPGDPRDASGTRGRGACRLPLARRRACHHRWEAKNTRQDR